VIDLPGHAPGQIGCGGLGPPGAVQRLLLHRGLFGRDSPAPADRVYNFDTDQALASLRKLAAWSRGGVGRPRKPLTGDVRGQLEQAAAAI